jgi:hypothetical protein
VSHNKTKYRENETREQNYFLSIMPMQVYNTHLGFWIGTDPPPPPRGGPGCPALVFFTLMVDAPGSLSAPPRGPPSMFLSVDGGRSWFSNSDTSQERPPSTSSSTSMVADAAPACSVLQGARHRYLPQPR